MVSTRDGHQALQGLRTPEGTGVSKVGKACPYYASSVVSAVAVTVLGTVGACTHHHQHFFGSVCYT
jgi:hypothetical protein